MPAEVKPSVRALMSGVVDYAGLFPPTKLDMRSAVERYAAYRAGADAWVLGRFVVPVARLDEFEAEAAAHLSRAPSTGPWPLSVLGGSDLAADVERVARFNATHFGMQSDADAGCALIDAIELKAATAADVDAIARSAPPALHGYVEIPIASDPTPLVGAIASGGKRAKVRTGGVTADAFPAAEQVVRFMEACRDAGVAFKATAGLHHAIRNTYRLTYEPDSPCAGMFGFVNVFVAAALVHARASRDDCVRVLEEGDRAAFRFDIDAVAWRDHRVAAAEIAEARREFAIAFGSCSFEEPVAELRALELL